MQPAADREAIRALTTEWNARGVTLEFGGLALGGDEVGGITAAMLALEASQSIAARGDALTSGLTRSAGGIRLDESTAAALAHEPLEVAGELGRGGMGIVVRAQQATLRRDVAVKTVHDGRTEGALASLLKEAWVGGHLAHPNVVPVHALVWLDGAPALVMKRIEGTSWRSALRDPSTLPASAREDLTAFHLRVLIDVANAVHAAHRRGVLHLDLKPENVMLGRFGEVAVLDWGLAAGFGDAAPSWLPRAESIRTISGTPDYMAPEIALGAGPEITPRTDVYLLGAALHEIVTGVAPHHGGSAVLRIHRAYRSEPATYGPEVPAAWVSLLHRAMHRDPAMRPASAEAFAAEVESLLVLRSAEARVREAVGRVSELERVVASSPTELEAVRAFGAARFAVREAETALPGDSRLTPLPARVHASMARWAIDVGRLELAATHLDGLEATESTKPSDHLAKPSDDPAKQSDDPAKAPTLSLLAELRARLVAAEAERAERAARLATLEGIAREESLDAGARFRRGVIFLWSTVFLASSVGYGVLERSGLLVMRAPTMLLHALGVAAIVGGFVAWHREALFRNRANATLYGLAILTFFGVQGFWLASWILGLEFHATLALTGVFYTLVGGASTALVRPRFAASALVGAAGLLLAAWSPRWAWEFVGASAAVALAWVGLAWPTETENEAVR